MEEYMKGKGRRERGFTLIELLVTVAIILVIVAVAIPSFTAARTAAGKTAAAASLRAINTAEQLYSSNCFNSFSDTIVHMATNVASSACTPFVGGATPTKMTQGQIGTLGDTALTSGSPSQKGGYVFTYIPAAADATTGAIPSWVVTAIPATPGTTTQGLCIDSASGAIHADPIGTNTGANANQLCTSPTL
jgi:prepilin-type N-terminal cleavage/methylation domain-containing protein